MSKDIVKRLILSLTDEINTALGENRIQFHQQAVQERNISLTGGNGRLWIQPAPGGYDVSLSGKSLEKQMYGYMRNLFGKDCDGYKQSNNKLGKKNQPYWRTNEFELVKEAAHHYARTQ